MKILHQHIKIEHIYCLFFIFLVCALEMVINTAEIVDLIEGKKREVNWNNEEEEEDIYKKDYMWKVDK